MKKQLALPAHSRECAPYVHFAETLRQLGVTLEATLQQSGPLRREHQIDFFACQYLLQNLVRKVGTQLAGMPKFDSKKLDAVTLESFLERERVNADINQNETWGYSAHTGEHESDLLCIELLVEARDIIWSIVGESPHMDKIVKRSSFGNGASATLRRQDAQDSNKFLAGRSVTTGLKAFATKVVSTSPAWSSIAHGDPVCYIDSAGRHSISPTSLSCVLGGVYDTVPKNYEINRVIIKEPELNGYLQKGIGSELRHLLYAYEPLPGFTGVNLNKSGQINSDLAREGSVSGIVATVDGEKASDSLTLALFEFLFPPKWYELFCSARSPYVVIPNVGIHRLEMMSGMGNGFTFEAESIVFYAIGLACAKRSKVPFAELLVSIHGDDLIVPADVCDLVKIAYTAAGVRVNEAKTFSTGPFRESCGGHFFDGTSVKPFYVKKTDGRTRGDWFWLHNSLLLWLLDRSASFFDSDVGKRCLAILRHIEWYASSGDPASWACPASAGRRTGLFYDKTTLTSRTSWKVRCILIKQVKRAFDEGGAYLVWLNKPQVSPTVYELLFKRQDSSSPYEVIEECYEVEGYRRFVAWDSFLDCGLVSPLWRQGRRSKR